MKTLFHILKFEAENLSQTQTKLKRFAEQLSFVWYYDISIKYLFHISIIYYMKVFGILYRIIYNADSGCFPLRCFDELLLVHRIMVFFLNIVIYCMPWMEERLRCRIQKKLHTELFCLNHCDINIRNTWYRFFAPFKEYGLSVNFFYFVFKANKISQTYKWTLKHRSEQIAWEKEKKNHSMNDIIY